MKFYMTGGKVIANQPLENVPGWWVDDEGGAPGLAAKIMELYPFFELVLNETGDEIIDVIGNDAAQLPALRAAKLADIGAACEAAITQGIEHDGKRYSLTTYDQIELMAQQSAVLNGAVAVPYHANGELCALYPAADFLRLAETAAAHVFVQRTYCNHLNTWVKRAETLEELRGIAYGCELPEDLKQSMNGLIAAVGGDSA